MQYLLDLFRYRKQTFRFSDVSIQLQLPRNLDRFTGYNEAAKAAGISEQAFPLVGIVWPSSELLCELLIDYDLSGKRILEVGCGMGLISHFMNARGADITALDIHPVVGDMLERNIRLNRGREIPYFNASWADNLDILGEFDLILGADILYEPRHVKHLARFLDRHLTPRGEIIVADPERGQLESFEAGMEGLGFTAEPFKPAQAAQVPMPYDCQVQRYSRNPGYSAVP